MSDTVRVGSRLHTDLLLRLPGYSQDFVLRGISHPAVDGMAVTENVPADGFERWMQENASYDPVRSGMVFAVPEDHDVSLQAKEYGFQPALDRLLDDGEQRKFQEQGAPDDDAAQSANRYAGLEVKLPNPIPTPPTEEVRLVPEPEQPRPLVERRTPTGVTDKNFKPGAPADDPNQDIAKGRGGAPSDTQPVPGVPPGVPG